jgi:glucokinase
MNDWRYPTLLADIGGTKVRFAIAAAEHAPPTLVEVLQTAEHRSLTDAAQAYLALIGGELAAGSRASGDSGSSLGMAAPVSAAFAVATPVAGADRGPLRLTNTDFTIDATDLLARLRLETLWIVNDFEALAWSLPTLAPGEVAVIGATAPSLTATMAVIGPGTGLGCAGLLRNSSGWHAVAGEGGHVTLAGRTGFEREVLAAAAEQLDHVSAERLLSGIGMPLLYRAVAAVRGHPAATKPLPTPQEITTGAARGSDPLSTEVVETFCALLGGYAGNVALTFGATGGVLIGGGIAAHLGDLLSGGTFRSRFEDKGRFASYLAAIGTGRILREQPALDGLVYALGNSLGSLPVQRPGS